MAAVNTTFPAKGRHNNILTPGTAKKGGAKAFHHKGREIQIDTVRNLKNKAQHPVSFVSLHCGTKAGCTLRVVPGIVTIAKQFGFIITGQIVTGVCKMAEKMGSFLISCFSRAYQRMSEP